MIKRQTPNYSARFVRSARKHLRIRSDIPTTSWTNAERPSSSNVQDSKHDGFNRKRMTSNHIGFKMPPHIDKSRSTGNVSVMVGKQLLLTCTIPNTGNESVSLKKPFRTDSVFSSNILFIILKQNCVVLKIYQHTIEYFD